MKVYRGLDKDALVRLWREQKARRKLDLLLHGPLFHDVFEPDLAAWRFYEDGTESGSTPIAAEDTNINRTITGDSKVHLRVRVDEVGAGTLNGASTDDYGLEYDKNSSGTWVAVTASSPDIKVDTASSLTADAATTNRATNGITDGGGSFVAGEQEETNGVIEDHQLTANNFTEHVFALVVVDADVANADTYDFRLTLNAGAPGMTNTVVPRITITKSATFTPDADAFQFHDDGTESGAALKMLENIGLMRNHTITGDKPFQLRWRVQETGGGAGATTDDYGLRYRKNGGAWAVVSTSSSNVQVDTASSLTDGGATTDRLSAGTGSFVAGEQEDANGVIEDRQLTASNYTNHVFGLKLIEADLASGDRLEFQLTLNAGTPGMTNSVTPIMMVSTGAIIRSIVTDRDGGGDAFFTTTLPPGLVEDDLWIVFGGIDEGNGGSGWDANPAGWNTIQDNDNQLIISGVWWRIAPATPSAPVFTATGVAADDGWHAIRVDGHDPTTPINVSAKNNGASTAVQCSDITPTSLNSLILALGHFDGSDHGQEGIAPSGTLTYLDAGRANVGGTSGGTVDNFWAFSVKPTAAAVGTATWTADFADGWHAYQIAIAPASESHSATVGQTMPTPSQAATGGQEFAAAAAQTMPTPSQSAQGHINPDAAAAQTMPTPSQSATGAEEFTAAVDQTMPTPSQGATGSHAQEHTAAAAQTMPTPSQASTGEETFAGTAAQTMPTPSQAVEGYISPDAAVAQTMSTPSQAATGAEIFKAAVAQTAPTPTQSATGEHSQGHTATAAQIMPTPSQAATGEEIFAAAVAQAMPTPSQSATGLLIQEHTGTVAQTMPTPSQVATGEEIFTGTAAQTVPTPSQSATGEHAQEHAAVVAQTMPTPSQAATGEETFVATVAQVMPTPSQSAAGGHPFIGVVAQTMPTPTQSATGTHASANMTGVVAQTMPTPSQAAIGGEIFTAAVAQVMPTPTQTAVGEETFSAVAAQTMPTPLQAVTASEIFVGVASQVMPTPSQSATGGHPFVATVLQLMPTPTQQAIGTHTLPPGIVLLTNFLGTTIWRDPAGMPTIWVRGETGVSLEFDGVDDNVLLGDGSEYQFGTGDFTMEISFRFDTIPNPLFSQQFIVKRIGGGGGGFELQINDTDNALDAWIGPGPSLNLTGTTQLTAGAWYHAALVRDAGTAYLYLNAIEEAQGASAHNVNSIGILELGKDTVGWFDMEPLDGALREARLWNIARSPAELLAAKDVPLLGTETGLVGYWRLNEGEGSVVTDLVAGVNGIVNTQSQGQTIGPVWKTGPAVSARMLTKWGETPLSTIWDGGSVSTIWRSEEGDPTS